MSVVTGAGQRDKLVTIEYPVESRDAEYSAPTSVWLPFGRVWARIEPLSGREYFLNRETQTDVSVRMTMDYRAGITNKMRVNYRGKLYQITTVIDPNEAHEEIELMCSDFEQTSA